MATKKTASEQATRTSTTSQPAKKPTERAKKRAAAPKTVRAKTQTAAPKVVRAKRTASADVTDLQHGMGPEERRQLIAEAAYLRAESRGFAAGGEAEDWLLAEQEIDSRLRVSASR